MDDDRLLRRDEVLRLCGCSVSALYRWMDHERFPRPVKIGTGPRAAVRWRSSDVRAWLDALPVSDPDSDAA